MDFEIRFQGLDSSDPLREHAELLVLAHLGIRSAEALGARGAPAGKS